MQPERETSRASRPALTVPITKGDFVREKWDLAHIS